MAGRWSVAFGIVLVVGASCSSTSVDSEPAQTDAETNQALWESLRIDDYRIVFERRNLNGMGGTPSDGVITATVVGGILVSCEVEGGFRNAGCDLIESTPVETLFEWVARYEPSFTIVRYDTDLGIPMRIDYDDPNYIDEEYMIVVKEFAETG